MTVRKRPAAKRKPPAVKSKPATKPEPKVHVADSGRVAAVQAGTADRHVHEVLTGLDQVPTKGMELGRPPSAPPFDPHARERDERSSIVAGIENDDELDVDGTPLVSTVVFVSVEHTDGDFEKRLREIIAYAEGKGFSNLTATIGEISFEVLDAVVDSNNG